VLDTQNLLGCAMRAGYGRIDYAALLAEVAAGRPYLAIACVAFPSTGANILPFVRYLQGLGVRVEVWDSPRVGLRHKVDLDPLLLSEGAHLAYTADISELCIAAHDGDYAVLAKACLWRGIPFHVAGFRNAISHRLRQEADCVVELSDTILGAPLN
jgi:hypothetical protein